MLSAPTDAPGAIERYESYRRSDPHNVPLLLALGSMYHRAGRFDDAIAALEEGLGIEPGHIGLRGALASVLISQHRFAPAAELLTAIRAERPEDPALLHNLGVALYHLQRYDAAREALEAACAHGAPAAETHAHLAYAWHHLGDAARARDAARDWARLAPGPAAEGYLSLTELDSGDFESAYRRADAVLAHDPDNVNANVVSGVNALEQQEIDRAELQYARASSLEPDNARAWAGVALVRLFHGEHARAAEAFERALALNPRNTGNIVALGWTHLSARDYPRAEAAFRRAIDVDRTFGEAYGGLASALVMQNRRDEARLEIERAKRLGPVSFGVVYAQSVLLGLEGKTELGSRLMTRGLERSVRPGTPSLFEYARLYLSRREPPSSS